MPLHLRGETSAYSRPKARLSLLTPQRSSVCVAQELIVGEWQLWDGGKLWQAPRVHVEAVPAEGAPAEGADRGGEGGVAAADVDGEGVDGEGMDDAEDGAMMLGDWDVDGEAAAEMLAETLARGAAVVRVYSDRPQRWLGGVSDWMGSYDRECLLDGEPSLVNGRYAYAQRRSADKMLWWSAGYWHLGLRQHVGAQTAYLIAGDMAVLPELITSPWMNYENGAWKPMASRVRCAAVLRESGLLSEMGLRLCLHGCCTSLLVLAASFVLDLDAEESFRVTLLSLATFAAVVLVKAMALRVARRT